MPDGSSLRAKWAIQNSSTSGTLGMTHEPPKAMACKAYDDLLRVFFHFSSHNEMQDGLRLKNKT